MENQKEKGWEISVPKLNVQSVLFVLVVAGFLVNQLFFLKLSARLANPQASAVKTSTSTGSSLRPFDTMIINELSDQGTRPLVLGSTHEHADFKVFINGEALDFAKPEYFMRSSFLHVDQNQNKEDSSGLLHKHAKNAPMSLFFRSIGIDLTKESLTLADGRRLKNENGKTLKVYVNGKNIEELGDYSFQPLDKILISYGPSDDPDLQRQIDSVTDFAKNH